MKKVITLLMVLILSAAVLSGCGERNYANKPDNMSKEIYDCGRDALEICDKYLAEQIDIDTAKNEINNYYKKAKKFNDENDFGTSFLDANNSGVEICLLSIHTDLLLEDNIKENRNELAEIIGK